MFRCDVEEVYPDRLKHAQVAAYIRALYGRGFDYKRNCKLIKFYFHPIALPGRRTLKRVLDDGLHSLHQTAAGKQREDALDDGSDIGKHLLRSSGPWSVETKIRLEHVVDFDEIYGFLCGHVGCVKQT